MSFDRQGRRIHWSYDLDLERDGVQSVMPVAVEQKRDVYAVPGDVSRWNARGLTH
jgi:hypothetical protein